jgi:hypothetical protein
LRSNNQDITLNIIIYDIEMIFRFSKYLPNIGLYDKVNRHLHNRMDPYLYFGPSTPPHTHKNEFKITKEMKNELPPTS